MKKKTNPSMTELADAAFERAAAKVIERAAACGTPIIIWENDEVREVEPQTQAPRRLTRMRRANGSKGLHGNSPGQRFRAEN